MYQCHCPLLFSFTTRMTVAIFSSDRRHSRRCKHVGTVEMPRNRQLCFKNILLKLSRDTTLLYYYNFFVVENEAKDEVKASTYELYFYCYNPQYGLIVIMVLVNMLMHTMRDRLTRHFIVETFTFRPTFAPSFLATIQRMVF